jgi:hypothetical protein
MSNRQNRPPAGQPWVWLTRELLCSDAWRALGINGRRFLEFLLIEHMTKAGKKNGELQAPRRQLEAFGISARHVSGAIEECCRLGLVDCRRGTGRRPSVYSQPRSRAVKATLPRGT